MGKKSEQPDRALSLIVEQEVLDKVRSGEITHISLDINDDNCREILHNVDGHLVLVVDELPDTFHSCYYYNNGEFPYAIKDSLLFLLLRTENDEDFCVTKIIDINTEAGTRFRFQGPGKPSVEDENGDNCIWEVQFEIVPLLVDHRTYLMRWNPSISSFTEKDYKECVANMNHDMFRLNWSIYDWQEARRGDLFYMMRVGDDKAGIVFTGMFITDPYPADDWAGSTKRRIYVDMVCFSPSKPGAKPRISLQQLESTIPSVGWAKGHSGELLSEDVVKQLEPLWDKKK